MFLDTGTLTAGAVIVIWGVLQSFALEYLWFVKDWFDALLPNRKKTVHMVGVLVITAGAYILSVLGVINAFTPDLPGLAAALTVFFAALGVSNGVHNATKNYA